MLLIVGLGNPGKQYQDTFHNCGFLVLDALAERLDVAIKKTEGHALTAHVNTSCGKVILAKPQTFMNLSGKSVWELATKYKLTKEEIVVVYDDVDLLQGTLRLRESGSTGTHNGMRDIAARIGTTEFKRVRIGIGTPPNSSMSLADYVLSRMDENSKSTLQDVFAKAVQALEELCGGADFAAVTQKYNQNGINHDLKISDGFTKFKQDLK